MELWVISRHVRYFYSHTLSELMDIWCFFLYCLCLPVLSAKCRFMALNLLLEAVESNKEQMMWLNSSIPKWLNHPLTHDCDFQYPGSPVGAWAAQ